MQNLQTELTTKVDTIKTLELKLEESGHTNNAKTQEMIRLEDQLREVKSELNAAQAQYESAQQNVSVNLEEFCRIVRYREKIVVRMTFITAVLTSLTTFL